MALDIVRAGVASNDDPDHLPAANFARLVRMSERRCLAPRRGIRVESRKQIRIKEESNPLMSRLYGG